MADVQISEKDIETVKALLGDVRTGVATVKESVSSWRQRNKETSELSYPTGISLLSLKNHLLLSYLHHLLAVFSIKLQSTSLSSTNVVETLVKLRVVLEKIGPLEGKLKYQIEKLVRKADQAADGANEDDVANDPLAFRPNPANLVMDRHGSDDDVSDNGGDDYDASRAGIYRPPRVAAMPYTEGPQKGSPTLLLSRCPSSQSLTCQIAGKKAKRVLPSHMISDAAAGLSGNTPYGESTSGLSVTVDPSLSSGTARHLAQVEEYELSNFTRMRMSKKDSKKRRNEEEEVAFGGLGAGKGGKRRLGGFGAEFDDLLGNHAGERKEKAYEQMKGFKKQKVGGDAAPKHGERAEDAGTSGLAGLEKRKGGKGKSVFDRAVVRAGKKKPSK
ncbi:U3 small nucleolar ribonucleoprotein LCP5, partial [Phenoliferia sp. Uapishka_3]